MATRKFYVFRNTNKESEKAPDYRMCICDKDDELQSVGALWKQKGPKSTYLSGKLDDGYKDREGNWIVSDTEKKQADSYRRNQSDDEPETDDGIDYPDEDITPDDIPF